LSQILHLGPPSSRVLEISVRKPRSILVWRWPPLFSSREPNKADDNELVLLEVGDFLGEAATAKNKPWVALSTC